MEDPNSFQVTVTLAADGTTGIQLSDTNRPSGLWELRHCGHGLGVGP